MIGAVPEARRVRTRRYQQQRERNKVTSVGHFITVATGHKKGYYYVLFLPFCYQTNGYTELAGVGYLQFL